MFEKQKIKHALYSRAKRTKRLTSRLEYEREGFAWFSSKVEAVIEPTFKEVQAVLNEKGIPASIDRSRNECTLSFVSGHEQDPDTHSFISFQMETLGLRCEEGNGRGRFDDPEGYGYYYFEGRVTKRRVRKACYKLIHDALDDGMRRRPRMSLRHWALVGIGTLRERLQRKL